MSMAEKRPNRVRGPGHDDFWQWTQKGELRLQRCAACGKVCWPVVTTCEYCGGAELAWDRMSGHGKIVSRCSFEQDYYRGALPVPYDTVLVELDEGALFVSNPKGFTWADIEIGMPVKVAFVDCEDAAGPFQLPVFEKA
jgi:uncharacterized protein